MTPAQIADCDVPAAPAWRQTTTTTTADWRWAARELDGPLYLYTQEPIWTTFEGGELWDVPSRPCDCEELPACLFPEILPGCKARIQLQVTGQPVACNS
jgi:hypothetical protein